jgi:hypothetical protein
VVPEALLVESLLGAPRVFCRPLVPDFPDPFLMEVFLGETSLLERFLCGDPPAVADASSLVLALLLLALVLGIVIPPASSFGLLSRLRLAGVSRSRTSVGIGRGLSLATGIREVPFMPFCDVQ